MADFGIFQDEGSERATSITSSDLDPFLLQGDEQTWVVEDWNWDPFNMFAAPKEVPNVACCQALKKRRLADNTAVSAQQQLQHSQQPGAPQPCHGPGASHRPGPPAAPAAAGCSVGPASEPAPVQHAAVQAQAQHPAFLKLEPEAMTAGCQVPGMAQLSAMPAAAAMAATASMGMGMGMGLPASMCWPCLPNMGAAAAAAAAAAASAPAFFANMAGGRGPLAAMGWGALPMPGLAMAAFPGGHPQCAPSAAMAMGAPGPGPGPAFQELSGAQLAGQASLALQRSSLPSPGLGSTNDTASLQGSADNARPPCCAVDGPACSGGRQQQQADSSNQAAQPPQAAGHRAAAYVSGGRGGGVAAGPGDMSEIAISDSEDEREEAPRRGGRGGQAADHGHPHSNPRGHLAALADVVALQDVGLCDDTDSGVCQVPGCGKDLSNLKEYHQRYRICDVHIKLQQVVKDGRLQRFCQQCGRFHDLTAFEGNRKSCREQLSKHNARRRRRTTGVEASKTAKAAPRPAGDASAPAAAAAAASGAGAGVESDLGKLVSTLMSNPTQLQALKLLLGVPTHPGLPAAGLAAPSDAAAAAAADAGSDQAARAYGLARDILAGRHEFAPAYASEHRTVRLSMKLFDRTPADLPPDLRNQVTSWLASSPAAAEAAIRPGCVFLTVQLLVDGAAAAQAEAPGALAGLVAHLVDRTGCPFWRRGTAAVQLGREVVVLRDGVVAAGGSEVGCGDGRSPRVRRLGPLAAVAGRPAVLVLSGEELDAPGCTVILRWGGKHMQVKLQALSCHRALVALPPLPATVGPVWVEVCRGAYLSEPRQLLVVRDPALAEEINRLDTRDCPLAAQTAEPALRDLALVLQHLAGEPGMAAQLPHAAIELKARRLLALACDMGWAAVASALLPLACATCSCAADVVAAVHAATAPAAAPASPGTDPRGLSLLHRAVRGGSLPLLSGMLAWGDSHGYRWPLDAAGPGGLTPLHLAVLLDGPRPALLPLLAEHCGRAAACTQLLSDRSVTPACGCACGGARPSLHCDRGELCGAQSGTWGRSSGFAVTALCQGCHSNRVLAAVA